MQNYWKLRDSKTNKLIFIKDKCIYKGNLKAEELNRLNIESTDFSFLENLFSIPYSYIKSIENQSGKNEIKIFFGNDSEEELIINDEKIKNEVFEFLKRDNRNLKYNSKTPSVLKYAKAQFFALLFTTGIFIASLYLAIQIEQGDQYGLIVRGRSGGILGIILAIANFGVIKILVGYSVLLGIIILALSRRLRGRSETEFLRR